MNGTEVIIKKAYPGMKCQIENCNNISIIEIGINNHDARMLCGIELCPTCYSKLVGNMQTKLTECIFDKLRSEENEENN